MDDRIKDEITGLIVMCVILGVFVLSLAFMFSLNDDSIHECEDVGGEYKVIDEEWSAATKTTVDVYGCVK